MTDRIINQLALAGKESRLKLMEDQWQALVDTDEFRATPPIEIIPFPGEVPPAMTAAGFEPTCLASIKHAPGIGRALLEHLELGMSEILHLEPGDIMVWQDFVIDTNYQ